MFGKWIKCINLHDKDSTGPASGEEETPASSSAENCFPNFCCSVGETMVNDFWVDRASVC